MLSTTFCIVSAGRELMAPSMDTRWRPWTAPAVYEAKILYISKSGCRRQVASMDGTCCLCAVYGVYWGVWGRPSFWPKMAVFAVFIAVNAIVGINWFLYTRDDSEANLRVTWGFSFGCRFYAKMPKIAKRGTWTGDCWKLWWVFYKFSTFGNPK